MGSNGGREAMPKAMKWVPGSDRLSPNTTRRGECCAADAGAATTKASQPVTTRRPASLKSKAIERGSCELCRLVLDMVCAPLNERDYVGDRLSCRCPIEPCRA